MPKRCKSIAGQRVEIGPGEPIIPGCELIEGSGIFNGKEYWPYQFVEVDGVAGDDGAVVIWPDTGNDLLKYDEGEDVPVGTSLHVGCVLEDGVVKCAPYKTQKESTAVEGPPQTRGEEPDDGALKGFCVGSGNVNVPTEDENEWLLKVSNLEIPDLEAWMLSGFTAKIQEMMGKLNQALGKLNAEVDKIMARATINPEDVCTPPVKATIKKLLEVMAAIMELMPVLKQIIQVIKIIQKVIKIVRKILMLQPPFIVPIVEKLMEVLNIMGLVDMVVSMLLQTIGRFSTILPVLQAQLMSILAQCAGQVAGEMTKEDCEAAGGTWIDPKDIQDLQDMYKKITEETSTMGDDESASFCTITKHSTKKECEDNGGTWKELDADTDFDETDTSALSEELAKQIEELDRCFSSDELKQYLDGF